MRITLALCAAMLVSALPDFAMAEPFYCIASNANCTASQNLSWSLLGHRLTIKNNAVDSSFISSISFDHGAGLGVAGIAGWTGSAVSFRKAKTKEENMLAGGSPSGSAAQEHWIVNGDTRHSRHDNGVGGTESITFDVTGVSAQNLSNGSLRIAVQLEGLSTANGASTSVRLATAGPQSANNPNILSRLTDSLSLTSIVGGRKSAAKNT